MPLQYFRANEQHFVSATGGSYEKAVKSLYMPVVQRYGETNVGTARRTLPFILSFQAVRRSFRHVLVMMSRCPSVPPNVQKGASFKKSIAYVASHLQLLHTSPAFRRDRLRLRCESDKFQLWTELISSFKLNWGNFM